ncbi:tetratricopeptide repeat protein, partial [Rhizobium sp. Root268]
MKNFLILGTMLATFPFGAVNVLAANAQGVEQSAVKPPETLEQLQTKIRTSTDREVVQRAVADLEKLAESGNAGALTRIGELYRDGTVIAADPQKAFDAFQRAADAGNAWGKVSLGNAYIKGMGVAADVSKGLSLIEEVAAS